ncbi:rCG40969 [Rattus norvegicus]|uniref:RCG40969 n=1 Tax=Rattus norvegicus TaxID=10116 RepID=A6KMQ3_RAT|nr:rCG40969 [Rattus norvegicus]
MCSPTAMLPSTAAVCPSTAVLPPTKAVLPPTPADQAALPASSQVPAEVSTTPAMPEVQAEMNSQLMARGEFPGRQNMKIVFLGQHLTFLLVLAHPWFWMQPYFRGGKEASGLQLPRSQALLN